ncbi:MAG TPA: S24 family peptidase [Blastocatellia bacterium]|nr:S24 family peptidase [Blastocatellia bacterium]
MRARSRTQTQNPDADLSTLDFLSWARYELSREATLKIRITGHSMNPTLVDTETVIIEQITANEINAGDIVLYASLNETAVIQRVLRIEEDSYGPVMITRGDACEFDNVPVPSIRVLGRVTGVERDGVVVPLNQPRLNWWQRLLIWLGLKDQP